MRFSAEATTRWPKTIAQLTAGELYPHCPRCDGRKMVYATIEGKGEYLPCPCCAGTGEADAEKAAEFIHDREWREGWVE